MNAKPTVRRRSLLIEQLEKRQMLSGVTLITHGHWGNAAPGGWVDYMADAVTEAAWATGIEDVAEYTLFARDGGGGAILVDAPQRDSGPAAWEEAVVKIDWSELSVGIFSSTPTGQVATAVANYLTTHQIDGRWLFESPVQLIGHSRGASLATVLAERLGELGIWVDQLTSLDPHPVDGIGGDDIMNFGDAPMKLFDNVRFADTYWREDWDPSDFDGEEVAGAFNRLLDEDVLYQDGYSYEHSDVHLWYHGTIDTVGPIFDGDVGTPVPESAGWYDGAMGPRDGIGYAYSRIRGGTRPTAGLASAGAYREPVGLTVAGASVWDNIEILDLVDHSASDDGAHVDVTIGYQDLNEDAVITVGYDTDADPYNGTLAANRRSEDVAWPEDSLVFTLGTAELGGDYWVYTRITNGVHTRYYYAAEPVTIEAEVVGRHVFYNNSAWDDAAIAPDKTALLPGGRAHWDHYTNYVRGLNGIMVDLARPPQTVTVDDFTFKAGNDDNPQTWATVVPAVEVRPGEGIGESDRVVITFEDYAIQNEWLEVTVLANDHTGLLDDDVFYFGNAVGETGNSDVDARVDAFDVLDTRHNPHPFFDPATLDTPHDFNRDRRVNALDTLIARNNQTWSLTELHWIDLAGAKKAESPGPRAAIRQRLTIGTNLKQIEPTDLAWLGEFDEMDDHGQRPRSDKSPKMKAVDLLLAEHA